MNQKVNNEIPLILSKTKKYLLHPQIKLNNEKTNRVIPGNPSSIAQKKYGAGLNNDDKIIFNIIAQKLKLVPISHPEIPTSLKDNNMKKRMAISLLLVSSMTAMPVYAGCRAGDAASRGAKTAYEEAVDRADKNAQKEKSSSDSAAQCLSGISAVITGGTFPTWDSVYKAIRQRVCAYVNQQVNTAIGDINGKIGKVYQQANEQIGGVIGDTGGIIQTPGIGSGTISQTPSGGNVFDPSKASEYWGNIWK